MQRNNTNISAKDVSSRFEKGFDASPNFLQILKEEQNHRHKLEKIEINNHRNIAIFGQIISIIYNIIVLLLVKNLIDNSQIGVAIAIFIANAILMFAIAFIIIFEKKLNNSNQKLPNHTNESAKTNGRNLGNSKNKNLKKKL